jgi:hypothetical protein
MKKFIMNILFIFLLGFLFRYLINYLKIKDFFLENLSLIFYYHTIYYVDNMNYKSINLNSNTFNNASTIKNADNINVNNTDINNVNLLRQSVKNSIKYSEDKKYLEYLKTLKHKVKCEYKDIKYKINIQKKTFL